MATAFPERTGMRPPLQHCSAGIPLMAHVSGMCLRRITLQRHLEATQSSRLTAVISEGGMSCHHARLLQLTNLYALFLPCRA